MYTDGLGAFIWLVQSLGLHCLLRLANQRDELDARARRFEPRVLHSIKPQ